MSKLDKIIAIILDQPEQPWSSEAGPGLTLLREHGIRYARHGAKDSGIFAAWHVDEPDEIVVGPNGLEAGCIVLYSSGATCWGQHET